MRVCVDPVQQERAIFALRGGSFNMPSPAVRPSYRNSSRLTSRNGFDGFRICITPENPMQAIKDPVRRDDLLTQSCRGGSWNVYGTLCRLDLRSGDGRRQESDRHGFRLCITPEDSMRVARDPVQDGSGRTVRGGCWNYVAGYCSAAHRLWLEPGDRYCDLGFRLSLTPSEDHPMITNTDTLAALTLALLESPADPLAWLALADYLEESGEDDRSTLVRSTLAMRQAIPGTPDHTCHQRTVQALIARGVQPCHPTIELDALPGARFAVIPPGGFLMGTQSRPVVISQPFFLGVTPITQIQWQHVMGRNPARFHDHPNSPRCPVEMVSWNDCQEFCQKLQAALPGWKVSLPTDAQWEYACRAGTQTVYYHGDDEESLAQYAHYNASSPRAVGELLPNAFGLHDMLGNVWEWCQDGYRSDPLEGQETVEVSEEEWRWLRGGAWFSDGHILGVQDAQKESVPSWDSPGRGLRVALDPDGGETAWQTVRGGAYINSALPSRAPARGFLPASSIGLRVTLDPTGPVLDPSKHEWGHIRGGSWVRVAGGMQSSLSLYSTQMRVHSLGLRVCVDPVQDGSNRAIRGGSWDSLAVVCTAPRRHCREPVHRSYFLGFRISLSL